MISSFKIFTKKDKIPNLVFLDWYFPMMSYDVIPKFAQKIT